MQHAETLNTSKKNAKGETQCMKSNCLWTPTICQFSKWTCLSTCIEHHWYIRIYHVFFGLGKKTLATASPAKFNENMFENQRMKQSKAKWPGDPKTDCNAMAGTVFNSMEWTRFFPQQQIPHVQLFVWHVFSGWFFYHNFRPILDVSDNSMSTRVLAWLKRISVPDFP